MKLCYGRLWHAQLQTGVPSARKCEGIRQTCAHALSPRRWLRSPSQHCSSSARARRRRPPSTSRTQPGASSKPRETRVFGKTARRKHRETRRLAYVRGRKHRETRCFATAPRRKPRKTRRLANLRCRKHRVSRRICARARARARALSPRSWPRRPGQPCSGSLHAGRRGPPGAPRAQPATAGNPAKRACLTRRAAESIAKRDVW